MCNCVFRRGQHSVPIQPPQQNTPQMYPTQQPTQMYSNMQQSKNYYYLVLLILFIQGFFILGFDHTRLNRKYLFINNPYISQ